MTTWTVGQLIEATGGELVAGDPAVGGITGIAIDSRRLEPRQAFLAIRGPRFDGHQFLPEAMARGAACLLLSHVPTPLPAGPIIRVADTAAALLAVAAFHRRRFAIPVIAVTGSCGKTTTKELIAHLLASQRHVLHTSGTENNQVGVPLTLLRLSDAHEVAVVELGSNHPGEIATLAAIARPTIAVITNVGPSHLEFFGSLDAIRQEKLSLLEALEPGGTAVVTGDQIEVLLEAKARLKPQTALLTFGLSEQCGIQALEVRRYAHGLSMRLRGVAGECVLPLRGSHNVENVLAALACLKALGIPLELAQGRLRSFRTLPMRSELIQCNGFTVLNDCYNANPLSFARALETLRDLEAARKVVIAGDMLELGETAPAAHQAIGRLAAQFGIEMILAVGAFAEEVARGASAADRTTTMTFKTIPELLSRLPSLLKHGDGILIKGSRKVQLERVTAFLTDQAQHARHDGHVPGDHGIPPAEIRAHR